MEVPKWRMLTLALSSDDASDCPRPRFVPSHHRPRRQTRRRSLPFRLHLWVITIRFLLRIILISTHSTNRAEPVHAWLSRHLTSTPAPPFRRPFNYTKILLTTVSVLGGISFLAVAGPYILPILQNRNLWAAISLIAVLLFTSGHMFNHIRKVPYVAGDGKGGIAYFAGGFQNQFGLETQIVAAMCEC